MELETIRKRLLSRREELAQRAADAGADLRRENDDVLRGLGDAARGELASINRALARIASGDYLSCSACGAGIDTRRLEAVPYADRCAACAR